MDGEATDEFLTTTEYERLRRATETYREDLVVAMAGRVGLRPSELTAVRPTDLREHERDGECFYCLTVPEGDGDTREAYVPREVAHDLRKFAASNDVSRQDPFVGVSSRRVQMLVSDVADRVEGLHYVTCRDLRKHFAWRHLVNEGLSPRVVQSVGGWKSLDSLARYYSTPTTTTIIDAFENQAQGRGNREGRASGRDERLTNERYFRSTELLTCAEGLGQTLAEASTDEDVLTAACEHLADLYRGVWLCDERGVTQTSSVPARATSDVPSDVLDAADVVDEEDGPDVTIVGGTSADGPLSNCSFAVTPLQSSENVHGIACVADSSFRSVDRTFLADVGRRVGATLTAITRKRLLLTDTGVSLSFRSTDHGVFLVAASAELDCQFALEGVVPVEDHSLLYFVTASGAAVGDVLDCVTATDAVEDARLIRDYGDDALFEFAVSGESLATVLVERGGNVRELSVESGVLDASGVFSQHVDVRSVVETVEEAFPETELRSKREVEAPNGSGVRVRETIHDRLTERQRTVLWAAYLAGYFEWPRGSTAEELAASMGVSSPTLHNHLRKAQQKLLDSAFEETDHQSADAGRH
ncbi:bacterio-opsin activator domain-containing protein [Halorussus halophilus]|uniref:bacterio-opsin activator domain-containing protein n=1 Tax=Halorussus halophilus TaxID=2650975 RepID=UPI001300D5F6|nr:bacterio-opsin activator domain-containing protein [Halorussus halophilus]